MNARKTALSLLFRMENEGAYLNLILPPERDGDDPRDRALLTSLLYGVTERRHTLDYAIGSYCGKPAASLADHTRNLLRLGLYQLFYCDKIPAFAAVSETVALAGHPGERSLLNGVLRRAAREVRENGGTIPLPPRDRHIDRYLSVAYSLPRETVKKLLPVYGEEGTEALLRSYFRTPTLTLRTNTRKTTRDALLGTLRDAGYDTSPTLYAPDGIRLMSVSPTALPGFADGLFYVQDEASQIAVAAAGFAYGERVLDLCAAPGGKTYGAAMAVGDAGRVTAYDLHASKLSLIESGAARLGLTNIEVGENDATVYRPENREAFDAVICDVPCSGLGVLSRKPDLRYADPTRFETLPPLQSRIFDTAAEYVKPGGRLMYSTCTLLPCENEERVKLFLDTHPEFTPEDFTVGDCASTGGMLTLYPHIHDTDGFFVARLVKKE